MKVGDLPSTRGKNKLEFAINKDKLLSLDEITMKFFNYNASDAENENFIFLDMEPIHTLYIEESKALGEPIKIRYIDNLNQNDMKIYNLVGQEYDEHIEFTITYESDINRDYSFFNPPNGNKLMYTGKLDATNKKLDKTFKVSKEKIKALSEITMKFYNYDVYKTDSENANFIFLEMKDVKKLCK